jgi:hypothetical protein
MLGYIQCQGQFTARLVIGPEEEQLRPATPSDTEKLPLVGHFSDATGERVMLYRWKELLRLRFGNAVPFTLKNTRTEWNLHSGQVNFKLLCGDKLLIARAYQANRDFERVGENPTPFVEPEDYDFLLFVHNVCRDSQRAERLYRT